MAKFEDGKRYRFSKEKLYEDLPLLAGASWIEKVDGKEVRIDADRAHGLAGRIIVIPEWCEEIPEAQKEDAPETRNCDNCKFENLLIVEDPCFTCYGRAHWEPKEERERFHGCWRCEHQGTEPEQEPCKSCSGECGPQEGINGFVELTRGDGKKTLLNLRNIEGVAAVRERPEGRVIISTCGLNIEVAESYEAVLQKIREASK